MPEASQPRPERKQASVPPSQSLLDEGALQLIARALADPRRYAIIKRLAQLAPGLDCSSVRECMDISPPTLSHHMRELKLAGWSRKCATGAQCTTPCVARPFGSSWQVCTATCCKEA